MVGAEIEGVSPPYQTTNSNMTSPSISKSLTKQGKKLLEVS